VSTRTVVYDMLDEFNRLDIGTASAIAYMLLLILAVLSFIQMRFFEERD
jgi:ABC-type sugar transport system permease subunit